MSAVIQGATSEVLQPDSNAPSGEDFVLADSAASGDSAPSMAAMEEEAPSPAKKKAPPKKKKEKKDVPVAGERSSPRERKPPTFLNAPNFKVKKTVPRVTPRNDKPRKTKTVQKKVQKAAAVTKKAAAKPKVRCAPCVLSSRPRSPACCRAHALLLTLVHHFHYRAAGCGEKSQGCKGTAQHASHLVLSISTCYGAPLTGMR